MNGPDNRILRDGVVRVNVERSAQRDKDHLAYLLAVRLVVLLVCLIIIRLFWFLHRTILDVGFAFLRRLRLLRLRSLHLLELFVDLPLDPRVEWKESHRSKSTGRGSQAPRYPSVDLAVLIAYERWVAFSANFLGDALRNNEEHVDHDGEKDEDGIEDDGAVERVFRAENGAPHARE